MSRTLLLPTPPRDVIGDVEGCYFELLELIKQLGYTLILSDDPLPRIMRWSKPGKRKLVFCGDILNRGPHPDLVINLVMQMVRLGMAIVVLGNQEQKYLNAFSDSTQDISDETSRTIAQVAAHGEQFHHDVLEFLHATPLIYETNRLIVIHAAYRDGVDSEQFRRLAVWGETDGTRGRHGQLIRLDNWEADYQGSKTIVHGHRAVTEVKRRDLSSGARIFNIDTKAAFGGYLTALRFPRLKTLQVRAHAAYAEAWDD